MSYVTNDIIYIYIYIYICTIDDVNLISFINEIIFSQGIYLLQRYFIHIHVHKHN
jgi:hypothetical protein